MRIYLNLLIALLASSAVQAEEIYGELPDTIHSNENYVFYSHGLIVEGDNPRPVHPEFGVYEFPAIKQAIFGDGEFNLIAHHRPANTDIPSYVNQLVSWVHQLTEAGVSPSKITLIGFSRGGQLTALAANKLKATGINTAIIAICMDGDFRIDQALSFGGHALSIYETSDVVTSCNRLLERSADAVSTKEVAISTGKKHGAFYTPMREWIMPLKEWLSEVNRLQVFQQHPHWLTIRLSTMYTSPYQEFKLLVVDVLGLSKDAIHVYLGLIVFFLALTLFKKGKIDFWAVLPVLALAISMEAMDLYDNYRSMDSMYWSNSLHDIINTTFWPLIIVVLARFKFVNLNK